MAKLEDLVESTHISEAELARNSFIERNILNIAKNAFNNENIASIGSSASGTYIPCREYGGISEDIDLEIVGNYDLMDTLPVIIGMREQIVDVCETALGLEGLHLELRKAEHHPEAGYKQVFVEVMDGDNKVIKIDFNYADKEDGTSWYRPVFEGQLNYLLRNINPDERVEARDYIVSQIRAFKQALKDHNVYSTRDGGLKGVGAEQLIVTLDTEATNLDELKEDVNVGTALKKIDEQGMGLELYHPVRCDSLTESLYKRPKGVSGWNKLLSLAEHYQEFLPENSAIPFYNPTERYALMLNAA